MEFNSTTTSTALVGYMYLYSSFGRVLDFKSRCPGSIPAWGELFISAFPLFPVTFGAVSCRWNRQVDRHARGGPGWNLQGEDS